MSHVRAAEEARVEPIAFGEVQDAALEALTGVAEATTPLATFRAITRARALLGERAERYWPLIERIAQRQGELEHMRRLAGTDDLTGVSNRRTFYQTLGRELARRQRTGEPVSVLIVDMDDLKWRNDTLGHSAGDEALRVLARACEHEVRTTDLVARLGGDEFGILLADSDEQGAAAFANRLRSRVERRVLAGRALCASIGVATASENLSTARQLVSAADDAMYREKTERKRGRSSMTVTRSGPGAEPAAGDVSPG